jgi:GNAT superfamily N-acetyltransferase
VIVDGVPDARTLLRVRGAAGMTVYSVDQAERGVARSLFGVTAQIDGEVVGIGRIIGDGGYFFDVVDIAVLPENQGKGIGSRIVKRIVERVREMAPPTAFITLFADKGASGLYEKFGFVARGSENPGMVLNRNAK